MGRHSGKRQTAKARNDVITVDFLVERAQRAISAGYSKQKWIEFCEAMMQRGLTVTLYEARQTFSKYLTVTDGRRSFKVRFSNHRPIKAREEAGDCDFFVGVTNKAITTTAQAIAAVDAFFAKQQVSA